MRGERLSCWDLFFWRFEKWWKCNLLIDITAGRYYCPCDMVALKVPELLKRSTLSSPAPFTAPGPLYIPPHTLQSEHRLNSYSTKMNTMMNTTYWYVRFVLPLFLKMSDPITSTKQIVQKLEHGLICIPGIRALFHEEPGIFKLIPSKTGAIVIILWK